MKIQKVCLNCGLVFEAWPYNAQTRKYCSPRCRHEYLSVTLMCAICGSAFTVPRCREKKAKYCSKDCANVGQALVRGDPWSKGKTKGTDPRLAHTSELMEERWQDEEYRQSHSGENHHMYGKHHTEEAIGKMRDARAQQGTSDAMLTALAEHRGWGRGLTKADHPAIARRAKTLSKLYKGKKNPAHSRRMKDYYRQHPEKHLNRILAQRGHETSIERAMRKALERHKLSFEAQYPIGSRFADFAFPEAKFVVEVDGEYWHTPGRDAIRDAELKDAGWQVLHFSETDVNSHLDICVATILEKIIGR